jgi:hypothetical protein
MRDVKTVEDFMVPEVNESGAVESSQMGKSSGQVGEYIRFLMCGRQPPHVGEIFEYR